MKRQPTPELCEQDVIRIVNRDYPESARAVVFSKLDAYGSEARHREATRVRLAALKLANGDIDRLDTLLEEANKDYRDVLASAEYPGYMDCYHQQQTDAEKQAIIDSDWSQYQNWLNRGFKR